jgi:hypothetical protein
MKRNFSETVTIEKMILQFTFRSLHTAIITELLLLRTVCVVNELIQ